MARPHALVALVVAGGLAVPGVGATLHAQEACEAIPVHTAALAEQLQLEGLGGVVLPGAGRVAPPGGQAWSAETRLSDRVVACAGAAAMGPLGVFRRGAFRLSALPLAVEARHATGYPRNAADGSFRPGVGTLAGAVGGFTAGFGPVTLVVRPEFHHHTNADFDAVLGSVAGFSPWIHPSDGTRIDLPQRFGDEPFTVMGPGQTTLRLDAGPVAMGASTENAVWGPGMRNPLLLSSAAPGMPHVFVGTARPVDIRVGKLFVRTLVGRTTESEFFDSDPDNDHRLQSATIGAFEPAFLPGFTVGAARFFALQDRPENTVWTLLSQAFTGLQENPGGADNPLADNQHASVFARWAFPDAGLQVYGEFARIDHWQEWAELVKSPQASGAWMAGLQKVFASEHRAWRVLAEAANLVDPMPTLLPNRSGTIRWYTHGQLRQGHTHQGQLLGAPIGPGGRQQVMAVDRYSPARDVGLEVARTVYNDDTYNVTWWRHFNVFGHDAELSGLLRGRQAVGPVDLAAAVGYRYRWNRHFLGLSELVGTQWVLEDLRREGSWHLELRGVWAR